MSIGTGCSGKRLVLGDALQGDGVEFFLSIEGKCARSGIRAGEEQEWERVAQILSSTLL